ncbi:hypothetical protein [Fusobacterium nucleatum]|uniref:hypothetical protein n=1 Tax=Fusobacterium nucleatum TaxID=851 RepID=UPI001EEF1FEC|nr:hypothetical protein [Fusobacterium nucleatum]MCG6842973.1 hypothetical protein [Fusobacterium nucleatum]
MKKYIGAIYVVIGVIILEYLGNLFFNWNFSFLDSLLTGICGALGYLWIAIRKKVNNIFYKIFRLIVIFNI